MSGWTKIGGDPASGVLTGTMNGITISSLGPSYWPGGTNNNSAINTGAANGTYFPAAVMSNAWFTYNGSTGNLALYNALLPQLKLSGLNADSTYILRMSSSCVYNRGQTQYTVAGKSVSGSQLFTTYNNTSQGVTFQGVQPDSTGTIYVYVNATTSSTFGFISGLQIFSGSSNVGVPIVALATPANGTLLPEGGNFPITATATETDGTVIKVEFYADTTKIGEVDAAPYTMTWTDPDPGSYVLTAKATDNTGTISTASVNVGVESLNYFWSLTGNAGNNPDSSFIGTVDSVRLAFRTKNIERMSILPTGNIGIGTITPTAQFHTTGSVRLAGIKADSTKTRVLVSDTSGNLYYRNISGLTGLSGGPWQYLNGTVYDSTDNIAIGTSNPQGYKLAVNGTGIFTKIIAKPQASWPDYVFDKDYNLPSLQDLARYIGEHHHLPDVTAEAEIAKYGIDLGAQQTTLLKKVEELTLYLIRENQSLTDQTKQLADQNKRLADQNKQLNDQNARLEAQQKEIDELKAMIRANHKQ